MLELLELSYQLGLDFRALSFKTDPCRKCISPNFSHINISVLV